MAKTARGFPVNGAAIAGFRRLMKLSQAALANEAGISYQYVSQLERGDRTSATLEVIEALAAALRQDKRAIMASPLVQNSAPAVQNSAPSDKDAA